MIKYRKISKVIALWNSYQSLQGSDYTDNPDVRSTMDYCLNEIIKLGYNPDDLPVRMENLILYLKKVKK